MTMVGAAVGIQNATSNFVTYSRPRELCFGRTYFASLASPTAYFAENSVPAITNHFSQRAPFVWPTPDPHRERIGFRLGSLVQ